MFPPGVPCPRPRPWPSARVLAFALALGVASLELAAPAARADVPPASGPAHDTPHVVTFEDQVRPILKAHCFDCHGEGDAFRGGLDLRLVRSIVRGGDSGPAVVPGEPEHSRILERVASGEMPPRDRKPTAQEIQLLRRWILGGARTLRPEPEALSPGMHITPEERAHWSFQPLRRPPIPAHADPAVPGHPVDAFLEASLASIGLPPAPEAPKRTLIRRLFIDLWGMPPTPEDVEGFLQDRRPDAYERLVDRLLDSPRYGERWARHWLDVAGYADSDGYTHDDAPRPYAYKYRDYVIRAFNRDLPFDRFLLEQIAGDELALQRYPTLDAAAQDAEGRDWLIATGFLRMAADGTASAGIDQETARNQVLADTLKIVSSSLLGLTVGCAQCHDHRYDPIPQTDYHRLRAVLEPAYDWKAWRPPSERLVSLYTAADRETAARIEQEAADLVRQKEGLQATFLRDALRTHLDEKFDPALREPLWNAVQTPPDQRTDAQKQLLRDHPSVNITPGVLYQYNAKAAEDLKAMDARIAEVRRKRPAEDFLAVLTEPPGHAPTTFRFHRGDPRQPREPVAPGTLSVLVPEAVDPVLSPAATGLPTTGRRLAFARWLTRPDHPLVARVLVNRFWMHHFGRGLVGTPGDFGLLGERPTHPDLLDWLASAFVAPPSSEPSSFGLGWSLKRFHRLILTSRAYRRASTTGEERALDPENRFYSRWSLRRLDAEAIRDSFLAVSGALSERSFGPAVPVREDVVGQVVVGIDKKEGDNKMPVEVPLGDDEFRRAIYIEVRRSRPLAFLNAFDAPVMEVNCEQRSTSTVAPQALMLMNSGFALQQASLMAARLRREAGESREARVTRAWHLAFGRPPTPAERDLAGQFVARQIETLATMPPPEAPASPAGPPDRTSSTSATPGAEDLAFRSLCQALLGSNEFLHLD